jgi:hypothetical protein
MCDFVDNYLKKQDFNKSCNSDDNRKKTVMWFRLDQLLGQKRKILKEKLIGDNYVDSEIQDLFFDIEFIKNSIFQEDFHKCYKHFFGNYVDF